MPRTLKDYLPWLFFALMLFIGLVHNNSISLWDQDEAAYAGFARQMLTSGDWLIPDFIWSDHHRKPPLHFWNIALAYKVFGVNEFSVRLPSALSIFGTYLLMYFWGGRLFGRRLAFISAVVLSTTYFTPLLSKLSVTDASLLFFSAVCAFSLVDVVKHRSRWAVPVFWAAFALALLTKGPPILLFCTVFIGLLALFHPQRKHLLALHPWFFLPLSLAPLVYWGYLASQQDGGALVRWMIDFYILQRVDGAVMGQSMPPGFHLLMILGFFSSYMLFLPMAFRKAFQALKTKPGPSVDDTWLLAIWFLAGWVLYEFSATKLPAYTIVSHVALAFLIGKAILSVLENAERPSRWLVLAHSILLILVAAALLAASVVLELSVGLKLSFTLWGLFLLASLLFIHRQDTTRRVYGWIGINLMFQCFIWIAVLPQADRYKNASKRIGEFLAQNISPETTVVIGNNMGHPPSLPYYAGMGGNDVVEETNPENLLQLLQENESYAFILNPEQKDHLQNADDALQFEVFESFFVDRKGVASYYVLLSSGKDDGE